MVLSEAGKQPFELVRLVRRCCERRGEFHDRPNRLGSRRALVLSVSDRRSGERNNIIQAEIMRGREDIQIKFVGRNPESLMA